jgi:hypothetical protein
MGPKYPKQRGRPHRDRFVHPGIRVIHVAHIRIDSSQVHCVVMPMVFVPLARLTCSCCCKLSLSSQFRVEPSVSSDLLCAGAFGAPRCHLFFEGFLVLLFLPVTLRLSIVHVSHVNRRRIQLDERPRAPSRPSSKATCTAPPPRLCVSLALARSVRMRRITFEQTAKKCARFCQSTSGKFTSRRYTSLMSAVV